MKAIIYLLAGVGLLCGCSRGGGEARQPTLLEESQRDAQATVSERDSLIVLVRDISGAMNELKRLEGMLSTCLPGKRGAESRRQLLTDIAAVQRRLQERRAQLGQMEKRLGNASDRNTVLLETIRELSKETETNIQEVARLRRNLADANSSIGALSQTVHSLSANVDSLSTDLDATTRQRNEAIYASYRLEDEMSVCRYIAAPASELKRHGIVKGGLLRSKKIMHGDFDRDCFTVADRRQLREIPLGTGNARVLTNHPAGSYRIDGDKGERRLVILDPQAFWSLGSYLVIEK